MEWLLRIATISLLFLALFVWFTLVDALQFGFFIHFLGVVAFAGGWAWLNDAVIERYRRGRNKLL